MKSFYVYIISTVLFFISYICSFSVEMYFVNPQQNWNRYYNVKFSNIDILVEPQGLFTSYKIEMELDNPSSSSNLQTELNWKFNLNQDDFMNNAWLWVGDTLVLADVLDKWTASMIYEGIVKRRQDPLLIMKSANLYDVKLYPFVGQQSRKFIIKLMIKNQMNGNEAYSNFPFANLFLANYTNIQVDNVNLKFNARNIKDAPILNDALFSFTNIDEESGFKIYNYKFKSSNNSKPINLGFQYSYNNKKLFFGLSEISPNEGFFQVSASQSLINIEDSSKVLFLLNYQADKTTFKKNELLDNFKSYLKSLNGGKINLNVMTGNYSINSLSDTWIKSEDNPNYDSLFTAKNLQLSDISMLPSLLLKAIEFIKLNSKNTKIVLINCSDEFYSPNTANSFMESLLSDLPNNTIFNAISYQNKNYNSYSASGNSYVGNQYFYEILTKQTGGAYYNKDKSSEDLKQYLSNSINKVILSLDMFEFRVKPKNGITYNIYSNNIDGSGNLLTSDVQYGRYVGTFPFEIEFIAIKDQKPYISNITINNYDELTYLNETEQIWYAKYLKDIETSQAVKDNVVMRKLVDISIEKRILTNYTAFLALEPWMKKDTVEQNESDDDGGVTDVNDNVILSEILVESIPNPFVDKLNIKIGNLSQDEFIETVQIYDNNGILVYEFVISDMTSNEMELSWTPENISKGLYLIKISTNKRSLQSKVIKI